MIFVPASNENWTPRTKDFHQELGAESEADFLQVSEVECEVPDEKIRIDLFNFH